MKLFVLVCLIAAALVAAQQLRNTPSGCATDVACFPWDLDVGPFCGRGNKMNLRFVVDLAPENYFQPEYYGYLTTTQATYAFCPRVDELQAFNLTNAAGFMSLAIGDNVTNNTLSQGLESSYMYVWGMGEVGSVQIAGNNSYGRVMVVDNKTNACPLGSFAIAQFLIMNISLDNGKYRYFPDESTHPQGTGFVPSCTDGGVCLYDTESVCIGDDPTRQMCAKCFSDPAEIIDLPIQIWASYYGTDTRGRMLRSGANNPMNFRAFAGSGVYSSVGDSVDRLKSGKTAQDDQLEP